MKSVIERMEEENTAVNIELFRQFMLLPYMEGLSVALDALRSSPANNLDFDTTRPQRDFVFRAEKELQKAANDLEQAVRRGAPQADIFNLQRKVEYKQYILGLLKGR